MADSGKPDPKVPEQGPRPNPIPRQATVDRQTHRSAQQMRTWLGFWLAVLTLASLTIISVAGIDHAGCR